MLVPAITRKEEILEQFKLKAYSQDMFFECGGLQDWLPNILEESDGQTYQYASVDTNGNLVGFIVYRIHWYNSCASQFGLLPFDKGNPILIKDLYNELMRLINEYHIHRLEWRMIGGNPVERGYDNFCKKFGGRKLVLKDAVKDRTGKYHDDIIYEIIFDSLNRG